MEAPKPPPDATPPDPVSQLAQAAVSVHEIVKELVAAGFTREEAIRWSAIWTAESGKGLGSS